MHVLYMGNRPRLVNRITIPGSSSKTTLFPVSSDFAAALIIIIITSKTPYGREATVVHMGVCI